MSTKKIETEVEVVYSVYQISRHSKARFGSRDVTIGTSSFSNYPNDAGDECYVAKTVEEAIYAWRSKPLAKEDRSKLSPGSIERIFYNVMIVE